MNIGTVVSKVFGSKSHQSSVRELWLLQFARRAVIFFLFAVVFLYCRFKMNNGPAEFSQSVFYM